MGAEFAEQYPKVAGRLGMRGIDVADLYRAPDGGLRLPHLARAAENGRRVPTLSQRLLEIIYPNYLSPTPSMAIAELQPDSSKGDISNGFVVPRGTMMDSQTLKKSGITCSYTTAHDVTLQPVRIAGVELGGIPADIPLASLGLQHSGCQRAAHSSRVLRKRDAQQPAAGSADVFGRAGHAGAAVAGTADAAASGLSAKRWSRSRSGARWRWMGCGRRASPPIRRCCPTTCATSKATGCCRSTSPSRRASSSSASTACAAAAERARRKKALRQFEIVVLLDRHDAALERVVDAAHLALHCTPVINLFPKVAERIAINENHEYHLVVDNIRPLDYEVFSVQRLGGSASENATSKSFGRFTAP